MAILSSLCGAEQEILSLSLHPMQALVPPRDRMVAIERLLVSAVNQVGVDINVAMSHDWLR